jgi:hypothetical protein
MAEMIITTRYCVSDAFSCCHSLKLTTGLLIVFIELKDLVDDFLSLLITGNWLGHLDIISGNSGSLIIQVKETVIKTELCNISGLHGNLSVV